MVMAVPKNWKSRFLETLCETANVRASCEKAGISRKGAYKAREKNEKFANDWDDAIEDAVDKLELAAVARAVNGSVRRRSYANRTIQHEAWRGSSHPLQTSR